MISPVPALLCLDSLLRLLRGRLQIRLKLLSLELSLSLCALQTLVVHVNPADLCRTDSEDECVDCRKRNVLGPDNEAPARPDGACAHEGEVLGEGELCGGAGEVGGASENHAPFHYWCPEVFVSSTDCGPFVLMLGIEHAPAMRDTGTLVRNESIPEVDGLGSNGAVPEASEAARPCGGCCSSTGICLSLSEQWSEAAEDAGARAERHICCLFTKLPRFGIESK